MRRLIYALMISVATAVTLMPTIAHARTLKTPKVPAVGVAARGISSAAEAIRAAGRNAARNVPTIRPYNMHRRLEIQRKQFEERSAAFRQQLESMSKIQRRLQLESEYKRLKNSFDDYISATDDVTASRWGDLASEIIALNHTIERADVRPFLWTELDSRQMVYGCIAGYAQVLPADTAEINRFLTEVSLVDGADALGVTLFTATAFAKADETSLSELETQITALYPWTEMFRPELLTLYEADTDSSRLQLLDLYDRFDSIFVNPLGIGERSISKARRIIGAQLRQLRTIIADEMLMRSDCYPIVPVDGYAGLSDYDNLFRKRWTKRFLALPSDTVDVQRVGMNLGLGMHNFKVAAEFRERYYASGIDDTKVRNLTQVYDTLLSMTEKPECLKECTALFDFVFSDTNLPCDSVTQADRYAKTALMLSETITPGGDNSTACAIIDKLIGRADSLMHGDLFATPLMTSARFKLDIALYAGCDSVQKARAITDMVKLDSMVMHIATGQPLMAETVDIMLGCTLEMASVANGNEDYAATVALVEPLFPLLKENVSAGDYDISLLNALKDAYLLSGDGKNAKRVEKTVRKKTKARRE